MDRNTLTSLCTAAALALTLTVSLSASAADKAPMPQTKGMQGMDPAAHDQPAPDCKPNAAKAAQQAEHPMPQTKGMQGMDPKAHEVDCPEGDAVKKPAHDHKAAGTTN
jgi:hypothetical protein